MGHGRLSAHVLTYVSSQLLVSCHFHKRGGERRKLTHNINQCLAPHLENRPVRLERQTQLLQPFQVLPNLMPMARQRIVHDAGAHARHGPAPLRQRLGKRVAHGTRRRGLVRIGPHPFQLVARIEEDLDGALHPVERIEESYRPFQHIVRILHQLGRFLVHLRLTSTPTPISIPISISMSIGWHSTARRKRHQNRTARPNRRRRRRRRQRTGPPPPRPLPRIIKRIKPSHVADVALHGKDLAVILGDGPLRPGELHLQQQDGHDERVRPVRLARLHARVVLVEVVDVVLLRVKRLANEHRRRARRHVVGHAQEVVGGARVGGERHDDAQLGVVPVPEHGLDGAAAHVLQRCRVQVQRGVVAPREVQAVEVAVLARARARPAEAGHLPDPALEEVARGDRLVPRRPVPVHVDGVVLADGLVEEGIALVVLGDDELGRVLEKGAVRVRGRVAGLHGAGVVGVLGEDGVLLVAEVGGALAEEDGALEGVGVEDEEVGSMGVLEPHG